MHSIVRSYWFLPVALAVAVFPASLLAQPFYTLTDIGTLGGPDTEGVDINLHGEITGQSDTRYFGRSSDGYHGDPHFSYYRVRHAFLYSGGRMIDLGPPLRPEFQFTDTEEYGSSSFFTESKGTAINDKGQVTGRTAWASHWRAFVYSDGQMQVLDPLSGTIVDDEVLDGGTDINNSGEIVGWSGKIPFIYSNGEMRDLSVELGVAITDQYGPRINDAGEIIGMRYLWGRPSFLYSGGALMDIVSMSGEPLVARAINAWGEVTGHLVNDDENTNIFLYSDGRVKDLGALSLGAYSFAEGLGINRSSQVVGASEGRALLVSGGVLHNLNDLVIDSHGWTLTSANAINDVGQIVCQGTNSEGQTRCLLLTPIQPVHQSAGRETYEAEKAALGGGAAAESDNGGFYGTGFVNFPVNGGTLTFSNVDGNGGGSTTIIIRYANGSGVSRSGQLVVNGTTTSITFGTTANWTTWAILKVTVTLNNSTANTIVLRSSGQDLANIDQLLVPNNPPPPTPETYQAETAFLGGGAVAESDNAGFNGAGFVNFPAIGGSLGFSSIDGNGGGPKTIAIRYANGSGLPRTGQLVVGPTTTSITFGTTASWTTWSTLNVTVTLRSGVRNSISLHSIGQDLANIDQITVP